MTHIYHHNNYLIEIEQELKQAIEEAYAGIQCSTREQEISFYRGYLTGVQKVLATVETLRVH